VSVRYGNRSDPLHPFSEAIGIVAQVAGDAPEATVSIITRRGETRLVVVEDVIVAKIWPI